MSKQKIKDMTLEISKGDNFLPDSGCVDLNLTKAGKAYCDEICDEGSSVRVSGWALIGKCGEFKRPTRFVFTVKGQIVGFCHANADRPDVLSAIDDKAPLNCGFTTLIPHRYINGDPVNDLAVYAESESGSLLEIQGPDGMTGVERLSPDNETQDTDISTVIDSIHGVALILSTKCNLRCSYCDPFYVEHDMGNDTLETIFSDMDKLSVKEVHFGVMGEPTIHKDFDEIARKTHESNYEMSIATNFASTFKEEKIDTLLLFHTIEISLDTLDIKTLRKIRTGADVKTILYNIIRLKSRAIQKKVPCPRITLSIVLNEETAVQLPVLAAACSVLGIDQCQLLDMRPLGFKQDVPNTLSEAKDKSKILNALNEAVEYFKENNIALSIDATVQSFIKNNNHSDQCSTNPNEGLTSKACLAPWTRVYISPDGHVTPCFEFTSIGRITPKTSLIEIINSSRMKRLRYELLTGQLNDGCRNCCRAEDTSPEKVREILKNYTTDSQRAETFGQPIDVVVSKTPLP